MTRETFDKAKVLFEQLGKLTSLRNDIDGMKWEPGFILPQDIWQVGKEAMADRAAQIWNSISEEISKLQ